MTFWTSWLNLDSLANEAKPLNTGETTAESCSSELSLSVVWWKDMRLTFGPDLTVLSP